MKITKVIICGVFISRVISIQNKTVAKRNAKKLLHIKVATSSFIIMLSCLSCPNVAQ